MKLASTVLDSGETFVAPTLPANDPLFQTSTVYSLSDLSFKITPEHNVLKDSKIKVSLPNYSATVGFFGATTSLPSSITCQGVSSNIAASPSCSITDASTPLEITISNVFTSQVALLSSIEFKINNVRAPLSTGKVVGHSDLRQAYW